MNNDGKRNEAEEKIRELAHNAPAIQIFFTPYGLAMTTDNTTDVEALNMPERYLLLNAAAQIGVALDIPNLASDANNEAWNAGVERARNALNQMRSAGMREATKA